MRLFNSAFLFVILASSASAIPSMYDAAREQPFCNDVNRDTDTRVIVSLYVMSRCPDARLCEDIFEDVLQSEGILDKINLDLNFIGRLNHSEPLGVTCKHGTLECLGNAHDLCLYHHLPLPQFYAALSCQNFQTPFPGEIGNVELTRRCAEAAKVDWLKSGVAQCIQGEKPCDGKLGKEAHRLLLKNIKRTEERGVEKSCTIEIGSTMRDGGKRVCVVDGGVWKGCDDGHTAADFVKVIEEEWESLRSAAGTT